MTVMKPIVALALLAVFVLAALPACRSDEAIVNVIRTPSGIKFEFRYAVKASESVEVSDVIVQEVESRKIVWYILTEDSPSLGFSPKGAEEGLRRGVVVLPLTEVDFGSTPAGFRVSTPSDRENVVLQDNVRYRVIVLAHRGSGMTDFTTRGECQKISFTPFTRDLDEFKVRRDC